MASTRLTPEWHLWAARSGASQPPGQRGPVLLSLHPPSLHPPSGSTYSRTNRGGWRRSVRVAQKKPCKTDPARPSSALLVGLQLARGWSAGPLGLSSPGWDGDDTCGQRRGWLCRWARVSSQVLQSRLDCAARNPPLASHSASVVDRWAVTVPLPRDSLSYFVSYCDSVSSYCDSVSTTPAKGQVRANSAGTVQCMMPESTLLGLEDGC